jgi:hypothetical protein
MTIPTLFISMELQEFFIFFALGAGFVCYDWRIHLTCSLSYIGRASAVRQHSRGLIVCGVSIAQQKAPGISPRG